MGKPSRVEILAEDQVHQRFVRKYLYRVGYKLHDIHMADLPSGRGCGEQWVRDRYAKEVLACRRRQAETALVVVIDADRGDVNRRLRQFQQALNESELSPRAHDERIVHLIPRRNIETWILCLNGVSVDEEQDYKGEAGTDQIPTAAARFFEWTRPNATPPADCVQSLLSAIPEARRLE